MAITERLSSELPLNEIAGEFLTECLAIADWWLNYAQDTDNGGFWGEVSQSNVPKRDAPKSIVLNTRILWFFSELAIQTGDATHAAAARRAYVYLRDRFVDPEWGGVYWMLSAEGDVVDGRKHTYAQAFAIYAFSAYYEFSGDVEALDLALMCFDRLEEHARDQQHHGYFEAYARNWSPLLDVRLSEKEDNSPKTMNTTLHVLEAFSGLYKALPDGHKRRKQVGAALFNILAVYCERVVDMTSGHLRMFMSEDWQDHSRAYSFGHDIESSWLIHKAIQVVSPYHPEAENYLVHIRRLAEVSLADGLKPDGSMADEYEISSGHLSRSVWWAQAEAMVGFTNMWAQGEGNHYLDAALAIWRHVQQCYLDDECGEWLWHSKKDVAPASSDYKIGPWKGPYHNGRAMLLMYRLLA